MLDQILEQLSLEGSSAVELAQANPLFVGEGDFPSVYQTSEFALNTVAAAAMALQRLAASMGVDLGALKIDRRLCSLWFNRSIEPVGWQMPDLWDSIAGDYKARDGWVRLHTNKPQHRDAAVKVLACPVDHEAVALAVSGWSALELESAVVLAGGCAASMRDRSNWQTHEQGRAVASEPLIRWLGGSSSGKRLSALDVKRPLSQVKILDLTRVLAGPVCTRFLASYGARVLRVDEPGWHESFPTLEMSVGKQRCGLDLRQPDDVEIFKSLLSEADVFVHGLRSDALARLGLGEQERKRLNPGLIDVALCAYGWSGPWAERRGFDSLVQMSCGIANEGMSGAEADKPVPLPCQALDHGTGYLMAAAVLNALASRQASGRVFDARLSLARTGEFLASFPAVQASAAAGQAVVIGDNSDDDYLVEQELTDWGPARRLRQPVNFVNSSAAWHITAGELRVADPRWPANSPV